MALINRNQLINKKDNELQHWHTILENRISTLETLTPIISTHKHRRTTTGAHVQHTYYFLV